MSEAVAAETDTAQDDSLRDKALRSQRRHRIVIAVIWILGIVAQTVAWNAFAGDRTTQVMSVYYVVPTLFFSTLVWWTFFSGYSTAVRLGVLAAFFLLVAHLFIFVIRFHGFWGGFIPMVSWRTSNILPTAILVAAVAGLFLFKFQWRSGQGAGVAALLVMAYILVFSRDSQLTAEEIFERERARELASQSAPAGDSNAADAPLTVQPGDWPRFRGPRGDGIVNDANIRRDWGDEEPPTVWSKRVGPGWSSFTVVDGHVFTQLQLGGDECVACYDLETGQELWLHKDSGIRQWTVQGGTGPTATPTFFEGRLYTLGSDGLLNCLDPRTGDVHWAKDILKDAGAERIEWGMSASPLAYDGKIIVIAGSDGQNPTTVAAYDAQSGEKLWSDGTRNASYGTPRLATVDGVRQLLVFDGYGLAGHNAESGKRLWEFPWSNQFEINVARPILRDDGAILISTSYGTGSALLRVEQSGDDWSVATTDWETQKKFKLKFGDGCLKDGKVYGLNETILTCLDLETGKLLWRKRGDYGFGQIVMADDLIIVLTETGEVSIVEALTEDHDELLRFQAIKVEDEVDKKTWNHPVLVRGKLLVRNAAAMACYDLSK